MSANQYLSDQEFAELFVQQHTVAPGADLVDDVEPQVAAWLSKHDMTHRNAFAIAIQVTKLTKKDLAPARVPTAEQAAFEVNQAEGISNNSVPDVSLMSMDDWAAARRQHIRRSSGDGVGIFG